MSLPELSIDAVNLILLCSKLYMPLFLKRLINLFLSSSIFFNVKKSSFFTFWLIILSLYKFFKSIDSISFDIVSKKYLSPVIILYDKYEGYVTIKLFLYPPILLTRN